ncbi:MAG: type II toxin-antitoxin system HicA family toxin [Candidatus Binatia bacterium]
MGELVPVSRSDLIKKLLALGFHGPYTGGRHEFLLRGSRRLIIPNPHRGDVSVDLLTRILKQAGVSREEWERTE